MSAPVPCQEAASLRRALDRQDFRTAKAALERYLEVVRADAMQADRTLAEARLVQHLKFLDGLRQDATSGRAHLGRQLRTLHGAVGYAPERQPLHTLQVRG